MTFSSVTLFVNTILLVLLSSSLTGQTNNVYLKSEVINEKASFSKELSKHLRDYQIVNINLTEDMIAQLQESEDATALLEISERSIVFNKFDMHASNMNSSNAITLESGNYENLTINKDFINGKYRKDNDVLAIQPLRDFIKGVDKSLFITYKSSDVINKGDHICTINEVNSRSKSINQKMSASACERIQLAIANDFSMFQKYGSATGVMNSNIAVINSIRSLFRSNFSSVIEFEIVEYFIPITSSQDPFTTSVDAEVLLNDFTAWAQLNSNPWGSLDFDMGELWTTRNIAYQGNSGTAGLADTPNSTSNYQRVFHILEEFSSASIALTNLTAHEMGHNFSAIHDPNGSQTIMVGTVPNSIVGWSAASITDINTRLSSIGGELLNCSCGETVMGPSILCTGDADNMSVAITEGVGPYTLVYNDGSSSFTINNYASGDLISISPATTTTYTIETIEDVGSGGLDFVCGSNMSLTVSVFDIAGIASANNQQGSYDIVQCDASESIALTTDISTLGPDQVIGWWITENQPISSSLNNANLTGSLNSATQGVPLSNPVNHIYESTGGNPTQNLGLSVNCNSLDDTKSYYATPFVSNKKDAIADTDCSVNASILSGSFNVPPPLINAKLARFFASSICRPQNPVNDPIFSYTINVSGYTGDPSNHFLFAFSPQQDGPINLNGNGSMTFAQASFNMIDDPGLENVDIWIYEEGGLGMANATVSVTLDITYPGAPAITFPNVSDVNTCTFGTPVVINCDCPLPPCNTDISTIDNTNVNDGTIVTSANQLSTSGITNVTTASSNWQAQIEVMLNGEFSVGGGSTLCINVGPCE